MSTRPSAREAILGKLRDATPWPQAEGTPRSVPKKAGAADIAALVEQFETKAVGASAVVKRVRTVTEAAGLVVSIMKENGVSSAILNLEEIVGAAGIEAALKKAGIAVVTIGTDPAAHKEACFTADAGVTGAAYGIAETGSLALVFDERNPRLVSHAPFHHIALLTAGDILPDTETLFARLAERRIKPSAMALVTGPSMTADIALTVIRGIHGPGKLSIVIIG